MLRVLMHQVGLVIKGHDMLKVKKNTTSSLPVGTEVEWIRGNTRFYLYRAGATDIDNDCCVFSTKECDEVGYTKDGSQIKLTGVIHNFKKLGRIIELEGEVDIERIPYVNCDE